MSNVIKQFEEGKLKKEVPEFSPGDNVKVHVKVIEGEKERIQVFQGIVIGKRKAGLSSTFTVRKISGGIGVERIFPVHSPIVEKVEIVRRGAVNRAKLYYLREKKGKAARIKEKKIT